MAVRAVICAGLKVSPDATLFVGDGGSSGRMVGMGGYHAGWTATGVWVENRREVV